MKPVILFVGDGSLACEAAREALVAEGYRVRTSRGSVEALVELQTEPVDVVACHSEVPQLRAVELLSMVQDRFPGTGRVLMVQKADPDLITRAINEGGVQRVVVLPVTREALALAMGGVVETVRDARARRALVARATQLTALAGQGEEA